MSQQEPQSRRETITVSRALPDGGLRDTRLREELRDQALSPRLNQILLPLLSITDSEDTRRTIREAVRSFDHDLYSERASSSEAELLEVLADLMATEERIHCRVQCRTS